MSRPCSPSASGSGALLAGALAAVALVAVALVSGAAWGQADAGPAPAAAPDGGVAAAPADAGPADAGPPEPTGPRKFTIDTKRSLFVIQVFKDGAAAAFAHDHTVQATEMTGEVVADEKTPETAKVTVTIKTRTLVNDDPQTRRKFGLDPTVPEKDRKAVEHSMKGDTQLDVARFPTISFSSTSVEKAGDKLTLVGDFTLHGVTKRIKMPVTVGVDGDTLTGDGKVRFLQSDYNITPYSAFLGAVKNKNEVVLNVHLVAVAK